MSNLLSLKFWFAMRPEPLSSFFGGMLKAAVFAFLVLAVVGFVLRKKKGLYRVIWERICVFSGVNFFLGLILMFFNYEQVPFFMSRFWYLLWALGMAVWLYFIIKKAKQIPERKKAIEQEKEFKKYIP